MNKIIKAINNFHKLANQKLILPAHEADIIKVLWDNKLFPTNNPNMPTYNPNSRIALEINEILDQFEIDENDNLSIVINLDKNLKPTISVVSNKKSKKFDLLQKHLNNKYNHVISRSVQNGLRNKQYLPPERNLAISWFMF